MSVEKRGTGYTVRWRDAAGRQRSQQVQLWRDAVALDGEMKRKKAMGELVAHEKGTIRCDDFWDVWVGAYGSVSVSPRTIDVYTRLWLKHISPTIGRSRLKDLDRETVTKLIARLTETLSPSTVHKCAAILQGVLARAVDWGYLPTNPAAGVRKPRLEQRRGRALTGVQLAALVGELPTQRSQAFARLLAWTGMRPGELRLLRWQDILGETLVVAAPKTNSSRSVDLHPEARRALLEWYMACGQPAGFDRIFGAVDSMMDEWTDNAYRLWQRKVFKPAAARAGLKGLRPYDLRHTAASRMIAGGKDVLYVARQLGHAPEVTLKTYAHAFDEARKSVREECAGPVDIARILRADGGT